MKKVLINFIAYTSLASTLIITSCDPDDKSEAEKAADKMNGTWVYSSVLLNGSDVFTGDWSEFVLTFSNHAENADQIWGGDYSASRHPSSEYHVLWPLSGSWVFRGTSENPITSEIMREDGTIVTVILENNDKKMNLSFTVTDPNARFETLYNNDWLFTLVKQ